MRYYHKYLRGGPDQLEDSILQAITIGCPRLVVGPLVDRLKKAVSSNLPSTAILRHSELCLEVALILEVTDISNSESAVVRFILQDSSPMCGFDWLWSMHFEVQTSKLILVWESTMHLQAAIGARVLEIQDNHDDAHPEQHSLDYSRGLAPPPTWYTV